jgi:enamine deaminase RidA (YjgF/YER057c/UK114 family)
MAKQHINPKTLYDSTKYGFSQAVVAPRGKTVYISGQVAWNSEQVIVGGSDLSRQAKQAFHNVQTATEAAGGTLTDIVLLRLYIVNYKPENATSVGTVLREFFGIQTPPASTWIGVSSLANKDFLIEIEAVAVIE